MIDWGYSQARSYKGDVMKKNGGYTYMYILAVKKHWSTRTVSMRFLIGAKQNWFPGIAKRDTKRSSLNNSKSPQCQNTEQQK
jgi:hypothetical protein